MAAYVKFEKFGLALCHKKHNLGSDSLVLWMSNTAPSAANDDELADITQITYTNASSRAITTTSSSQTGGAYSLVLADITITASGGSVGPFRYVGVYNDTATNDDLVGGYYDYGSSITLADTESILIDLNALGFFDIT